MKPSAHPLATMCDYLARWTGTDDADGQTGEDAVALLAEKNVSNTKPRSRLQNARTRWYCIVVGLCGVFLVLVAVSFPSGPLDLAIDSAVTTTLSNPYSVEHRHFHIALASSIATLGVCQSVLSAAVLGYPTPWMVGWEKEWGDGDRAAHEIALLKLKTVEAWLNKLPQKSNSDIVAVLGNPNAMFQARPEVLLKRYFKQREQADAQLEHSFSNDILGLQNMYTKVIFSTALACTPSEGQTCDEFQAEDGSTHYLSSDLIIGQIGMMRALWNRAVKYGEEQTKRNETFTDSTIFSHILQEQNLQRETVQAADINQSSTKPIGNRSKEFGIALDVLRQLSYTTDFEMKGYDWIKHKGSLKVPVPEDIASSMSPFWTVSGTNLPSDRKWEDVSLLTSDGDDSVPALVYQGPATRGLISGGLWAKLWFHPHARQLLDSFALTPIVPVAILPNGTDGEVRWWSPHWEKVGVKNAEHGFHDWEEFCGSEEHAKSLFLDEGGPWADPRLSSTHYYPQDS